MAAESARARPSLLALLGLLLAVSFTAWARIHVTLTDRNFDARSADGMLRSDPGLLYYFTERIIESKGGLPEDFHADRRVQHPDPIDIPAKFTIGQEFLVAWAWLLVRPDMPLHVFCVIAMSVLASLAACGVFGLAWELTRRSGLAALAALLYAVLLYNYRTVGAILIREDLSLPAFAIHLWLLARAARVRSAGSFVAAGLALSVALASWHAMSFVVAIEAAVFFAWLLRTGESPFDLPRAWCFLAVAALAGVLVPVLWSTRLLLSPAMQLGAAMLAVSLADRRRAWRPWRRAALALVALAAAFAASRLAGGQGDYSHVTSLMLAKVRHLGALPKDPSTIDFDARLLWQGPFMTAKPSEFLEGLGLGCAILAAGIAAAPGWIRGHGDRGFLLLAMFAGFSTISAWLVSRTLVLLGIAVPALGAVLVHRLLGERRDPRVALGVLAALVAGQTLFLFQRAAVREGQYIGWYAEPPFGPARNAELARLVRWARENLPPDAGIASDYVTSTALLAHNRNGIVCQPKYEIAESRRRIEEFAEAYVRGTPEDFRRFAKRYDCRYAVIDRLGNWWLLGYPAGYPFSQVNHGPPPPGTAAEVFGSTEDAVLKSVPGFKLLYRAPPQFQMDFYRVYEVE